MTATTRLLSANPYFKDFGNNLVDDFGSIPEASDAEVHAARLTVAAHAESVEDAAELLAMLGLGDA